MQDNPGTIHQKKIAVAMSGGVDSSVAAALLKKQGHAVTGVFMKLAQPDLAAQTARVKEVAAFLDVPLEFVELSDNFEEEVLEYFTRCYYDGKTPNPCVVCNRQIKFGRLLDHALSLGADALATGHYARIAVGAHGERRLLSGLDPKKDQSYFLCLLRQEQLKKTVFPLGDYTKKEVYLLAGDSGLQGRHGVESQDVCFLENRSVAEFLAGRAGRQTVPGSIVTLDGRQVGRHGGIQKYTVGQRRGLGIPDATPYYVVDLDVRENLVIVGKKEDLFRSALVAANVNWTAGRPPLLPQEYMVKIRYRHQAAPAMVTAAPDNRVLVTFKEPQRAVTPGQFAAFYKDEEVKGGGEIVAPIPAFRPEDELPGRNI